jgi:UDP-glucose 4-epimerase
MERVLVTGGAGFIGSHLVDSLLDSGRDVLVVDNFSLGTRAHLDRSRAAGGLSVVAGDIRSMADLQPVADFAPDAVFHMAALHFIPYCNTHPAEALEINVLGLDTLIRSLRDAPVRTFVFPSSGAIYGFGDDPWSESAAPRPDEIYGISKWMGEQMMGRFHEDRPGVRAVIARLFNTYGPRETNPHVLPDIMQRLREGKVVELGNLWPKRDLIYVTDTAAGLVAAADGPASLDVYNVGTGSGTAIKDVLQSIETIRGTPVEVKQVPERTRDGDGHLVADPGKLLATGWKPEYDLYAGLHRLLDCEGLL